MVNLLLFHDECNLLFYEDQTKLSSFKQSLFYEISAGKFDDYLIHFEVTKDQYYHGKNPNLAIESLFE